MSLTPGPLASSFLEVDETKPNDGKEHECDHEAHEDGNDLAAEMPLVVKVGCKVVLEGQELASWGGKGALEITQLENDDAIQGPSNGIEVVVPYPPSRHPLHTAPSLSALFQVIVA